MHLSSDRIRDNKTKELTTEKARISPTRMKEVKRTESLVVWCFPLNRRKICPDNYLMP